MTTPASASPSPQPLSPRAHILLWLAAAVLGLVTSLGVRLFTLGYEWVNRVTVGTASTLPAPLGSVLVVSVPVVGGIVVALWMHAFTRPAALASMAHIIDGVTQRGGRLDIRNSFVFVLGSLVGIGVGAPVGADTPSAMIGGNLGSWLAQRLHWNATAVRALVVAGVGAGISATYFAQLAAVFFALEIVLGGFGGPIYVIPTLVAVAVSAFVAFSLGGAPPQYVIPTGATEWNWTLLPLLGAALLAALAAIAYVNLLPWCKRAWAKVRLPFWAKTALAGLLIGVVSLYVPQVTGTGLHQMQAIFSGQSFPLTALLALAIAKLLLTPTTLGSGFVGGVIGPSLAIGAALGAAYGMVIAQLIPGTAMPPVAFAMVATAAMLAGTFHAPLFGAMMMYEMSGDYRLLLPLLFAAAIGYGVARWFQPGSAYTFAFHPLGISLRPGTFVIGPATPLE